MNIRLVIILVLSSIIFGCSSSEQDAAVDRQVERIKSKNEAAKNEMDAMQEAAKDNSGDFKSFDSSPGKRVIEEESKSEN